MIPDQLTNRLSLDWRKTQGSTSQVLLIYDKVQLPDLVRPPEAQTVQAREA